MLQIEKNNETIAKPFELPNTHAPSISREERVQMVKDEIEKLNQIHNETTDEGTSNSDESQEDSEAINRSFVITEDKIYLTVRERAGWFSFAHIENDQISYATSIHEDGRDIYPQQLPVSNGVYVPIVGVPIKEFIDEAQDIEINDLMGRIHSHLAKYIDAPETDIEMFIHFILFTWFYKKLNTTPYLRFLGDTGKGKSRFLKVIADLCFYPITVEGASTTSGILRFKEQWNGTLKIDEADFAGGTESQIIKYLNLGFEEGHYIAKTNIANHKEQEFFDPFCPKVIAMRKPFQDNATEGRLLSFSPRETTRRDIPSNLPPEYNGIVDEIRGIIARFVLQNWNNVDPNNLIDCSDMDIEPRLKQLTIPLSLILQLMPDGKERFKEYISRRQEEVKAVRSQSWEGILFNYVFDLAKGNEHPGSEYHQYSADDGILAITPSMVANHFGISAKTASQTLASIGMTSESKTVKIPSDSGSETKSKKTRLYVVPDENAWSEIIQRYYYVDDDSEEETPSCPEVLRSKTYMISRN
ncbi:hypothetical protein HNV12_15880 [Methanococcoides sp. SA1]|nr:hypothetical protein [Methanococcoides sp. SA1]